MVSKATKNAKKIGGAKKKRNIVSGVVSVQATFNNVIITVSDLQGNVISWSSAGTMGFKGSKKSTPYAAQVATDNAIEKAKEYGLQTVKVDVRGPGVGRESALRSIQNSTLNVTSIADKTYHPHNGCRPRKRRRV